MFRWFTWIFGEMFFKPGEKGSVTLNDSQRLCQAIELLKLDRHFTQLPSFPLPFLLLPIFRIWRHPFDIDNCFRVEPKNKKTELKMLMPDWKPLKTVQTWNWTQTKPGEKKQSSSVLCRRMCVFVCEKERNRRIFYGSFYLSGASFMSARGKGSSFACKSPFCLEKHCAWCGQEEELTFACWF